MTRPTVDDGAHPQQSSESSFRRRDQHDNALLFRKQLPLGAAAWMAFAGWDYLLSPELARDALLIRLSVLAYYVLAYVGSWQPWFPKHHDWILGVGITYTGAALALILYLLPQGFVLGIAGVGVCIMAVSGFFWLPTVYMVVSCTLIMGFCIVLMLRADVSTVVAISNSAFLLAFSWYGIITNWRHERDKGTLFAEKLRSDELVQEVTTLRHERLNWLENLARFLRHELKNQVVAIGTSLSLLESTESNPDPQPLRYVGRARKSLDRMDRLLRSATEATSLEAALHVESRQRVDLSEVLVDRVATVRQSHPRREFQANIQQRIQLDGNEDRLVQLLDKLVDNAVEHSADGAEIRLTLRKDDSQAVLIVENDGDPLPADKEALFEPFVTVGKSNQDAANVGLGLFVAKAIAEAHGGTIQALDRTDPPGARFELRVPVVGE